MVWHDPLSLKGLKYVIPLPFYTKLAVLLPENFGGKSQQHQSGGRGDTDAYEYRRYFVRVVHSDPLGGIAVVIFLRFRLRCAGRPLLY